MGYLLSGDFSLCQVDISLCSLRIELWMEKSAPGRAPETQARVEEWPRWRAAAEISEECCTNPGATGEIDVPV